MRILNIAKPIINYYDGEVIDRKKLSFKFQKSFEGVKKFRKKHPNLNTYCLSDKRECITVCLAKGALLMRVYFNK